MYSEYNFAPLNKKPRFYVKNKEKPAPCKKGLFFIIITQIQDESSNCRCNRTRRRCNGKGS